MMSAKLHVFYRGKDVLCCVKESSRHLRDEYHTCGLRNISIKKYQTVVNKNSPMFTQKPLMCNDSMLLNTLRRFFYGPRGYCTQNVPKNANIFGDLASEKYEKVEMDEAELAEEEFVENEVRIPRRLKPSTGQYTNMIKEHVNKNDLTSALSVLDLIKQNRDKPTAHMYNLIIRCTALQGNMKQAFKLYNDMKKRGLSPNAATYTTLINACSIASNSTKALEHLHDLREKLYDGTIPANATHYNALIKAYSWQRKIVEAFQIADEMRDKKLPTDEVTFNSLLHAAIADKEAGLKHALIVWHLMRYHRIKPSVKTYNLLLRAVRDTNCGDLKMNDILVSGVEDTRICLNESERPDLLASPPALSNLLIPYLNSSSPGLNTVSTNENNLLENLSIKDVLLNNRLVLFGGYEGILKRMDADDVKPDIRTITLLMELAPNFASVENAITKCAKQRGVKLDTDYYNMVIKKRSMRFQYESAKETLYEMQRDGLQPNIMTFGVLALGCTMPQDANELLEGMKATGFAVNVVIMGTLIANACHKKHFSHLYELLDYMYRNSIMPSKKLLEQLKQFEKDMKIITTQKGNYSKQKMMDLKERFTNFQKKYANWLHKVEEKERKYKEKYRK